MLVCLLLLPPALALPSWPTHPILPPDIFSGLSSTLCQDCSGQVVYDILEKTKAKTKKQLPYVVLLV